MHRDKLLRSLTASLHEMYEKDVTGNLVEFWQGEVRILQYLFENREMEINPSILSDALNVSRARITTALTALRKKGFIVMEMCPDDRRRMLVKMTDTGEAFITEKQNEVINHFKMFVEGIGEENVKELIRLIRLTIEVIEQNKQKEESISIDFEG